MIGPTGQRTVGFFGRWETAVSGNVGFFRLLPRRQNRSRCKFHLGGGSLAILLGRCADIDAGVPTRSRFFKDCMKALLIAKNGDELYFTNVDEHLRGGFIDLVDKQPMSVTIDDWIGPITVHVRSFKWTGRIIRESGRLLFDLFEEVEK